MSLRLWTAVIPAEFGTADNIGFRQNRRAEVFPMKERVPFCAALLRFAQ
jgi:hypothetical protein